MEPHACASLSPPDASDFVSQNSSLVLNAALRRDCIHVIILDNEEFEDDEMVEVVISSFSVDDPDLVVLDSRPSVLLSIIDDDRDAVVGFLPDFTVVNGSEALGTVMLCVGVLFPGPELGFESVIEVVVGTRRGTAGEI